MLNILVLEDDAALAGELLSSLTLLGHNARWSDAQTLRALDADYDLVMLDLGLGRIDGFEILEQMAGTSTPPPVAIMSGCDRRFMETARALALARGLNLVATLSKPFTFATLQAMLDGLRTPTGSTGADVPAAAATLPYYVFQYKNDLHTGAPVGCEILVRLPGVSDIARWFEALKHDRIFDMTVAAAGAAIDLRQRLERQGTPLPVAFNCPPDIFGSAQFLDRLRGLCADAQVEPAAIAIELTEQHGSLALLELSAMACRYALAGFPIHLDDFGTGSSSVEQLLKLPLNELKIDRGVFRDLSHNGRTLLSEITAFCRANAILSTIEGIETEMDLKIAREAGADYGQGFLWSRPRPVAQLCPRP